MKRRVRILYEGREFTIPEVGGEEVRARIDAALTGGDPWLQVTSGFGRGVTAYLRVSPGIPIAVSEESTEFDGGADEPPPDQDPLA